MSKMLNKIKSIVFLGAFSALLILSLQADAYNKYANTCTGGNCEVERPERKELTPEEKECLDDARKFVFSYEIVRGMHSRYEREFGSVPAAVKQDLAWADEAWYELERLGSSSLYAASWSGALFTAVTGGLGIATTPSWALEYCDKMYAKEMNSRLGSNFQPTSNDPFLESNYVCHTSYQDALNNMRRILDKYRSGHRCK